MSISNLRWTKGAPEFLLPGMVVRIPAPVPGKTAMFLAGTLTSDAACKAVMESAIEWAQAIAGFEMDWLNDMGVPAKVVA